MAKQGNITGRDRLILLQALYYAVKYIDALPDVLQERSNRHDMMKILLSIDPNYLEKKRREAKVYESQEYQRGIQNQPIPSRLSELQLAALDARIKAHRTVPPVDTLDSPYDVTEGLPGSPVTPIR